MSPEPRRSTTRPTDMRRTLSAAGLVVSLAAVAGCGDDDSSVSATPTTPISPTTTGPVEATVVAIVSETAAGGRTTATAVPVDRPAQAASFVAQFNGPLAGEVRREAAAARRPGVAAYAQVVMVGCDVPPSVSVRRSPAGIVIVPDEVASPLPECFAPVTSVAVVTVP